MTPPHGQLFKIFLVCFWSKNTALFNWSKFSHLLTVRAKGADRKISVFRTSQENNENNINRKNNLEKDFEREPADLLHELAAVRLCEVEILPGNSLEKLSSVQILHYQDHLIKIMIILIMNHNCNKVNRCLARYSPRATTTNRPTNRALNKPAWPGPN